MTSNFKKYLDINIYRERIKEDFTYARNRLFPIRVIVSYDNKPFSNKYVDIINGAGVLRSIKTDKGGHFVYFPKGLEALDVKKILDQEVILAQYQQYNIIYKSSYTVLFKDSPHKKRIINTNTIIPTVTQNHVVFQNGGVMTK